MFRFSSVQIARTSNIDSSSYFVFNTINNIHIAPCLSDAPIKKPGEAYRHLCVRSVELSPGYIISLTIYFVIYLCYIWMTFSYILFFQFGHIILRKFWFVKIQLIYFSLPPAMICVVIERRYSGT